MRYREQMSSPHSRPEFMRIRERIHEVVKNRGSFFDTGLITMPDGIRVQYMAGITSDIESGERPLRMIFTELLNEYDNIDSNGWHSVDYGLYLDELAVRIYNTTQRPLI